MKKIKAPKILNNLFLLKPGQYISWVLYKGENALDAITVFNYVNPFFKTGEPMPIPTLPMNQNRKINVISLESSYNDSRHEHMVIIEGEIV